MAAIITSAFRLTNAESFINNLQNSSNYYLVIGRPYAWADDLTAPNPVDASSSWPKYWKESMAAKRIQSSDVIQSTLRYNWNYCYESRNWIYDCKCYYNRKWCKCCSSTNYFSNWRTWFRCRIRT